MSQERCFAMFGGWRIGLYRLFVALAAGAMLGACATGPALVVHTFSFDARQDSPDVEILDYRYGDSRQPGARAEPERVAQGRIGQQWSVSGAMLRGDFLFVKWRIKKTGQIYEDTVNLTARLPADISNHDIHFVVNGPRLYVYLVSPERRPPDMPANGPRRYSESKVFTIYPDQPKTK